MMSVPKQTQVLAAQPGIASQSQATKKRTHRELEEVDNHSTTNQNDQLVRLSQTKDQRSPKKSKKNKDKKASWKVSEPVGGLLADLLPIFSPDENHLLLAYSQSIKIYSTATSMLIRTCSTRGTDISSFCLSSQNPDRLYVLLQDGKIQWWDWTTGMKLKAWDLGAQISDISVNTSTSSPEAVDTFFTSEFWKSNASITAHHLLGDQEKTVKVLYKQREPIRAIKTMHQGKFIIATCNKSIIVGTRTKKAGTRVQDLEYSFNTFDTPEVVTCFDARVTTTNGPKGVRENIDIAVGMSNGAIHIYYNTAPSADQKQKDQRTTPSNTKHHWHRNSVGSVAWSSGNYLVSGGLETVLVIWQLDTGTKTTLPHLTSIIESIVVAPNGASYALRLGDNSTMIMDVQDLTPTFNVAGVGFPAVKPTSLEAQLLPSRRAPISCTITQPPRLVSAVPSEGFRVKRAQSPNSGVYANTNLQSIPLSNSTASVSKQALVDSLATTIRQRPDGKQMITSNVVLLEISEDGTWMATIDEWIQPLEDILPNAVDTKEAQHRQSVGIETNLVLWQYNRATEAWDRSTRIPNPHANDNRLENAGVLVLDLVAAHSRNAFWTLGSDGVAKCWTPMGRDSLGARSGTTKHGPDAVWKCTKSLQIPYASFRRNVSGPGCPSARLTISKDETVFAASRMSAEGSELTVFIAQSGQAVKRNFTFNTKHQGITAAILGQYLIMADCASVVVRDLTDSRNWYKTTFGNAALASDLSLPPHIVLDHEHELFAISIPRKLKAGSSKARRCKIMVFSPTSNIPIATLDNQPASAALLCVPSQKKFYCLTTEAEIYSISPNLSKELNKAAEKQAAAEKDVTPSAVLKPANTLRNIFGEDAIMATAERSVDMDEVNQITKRMAWDEIPGLNLDQPFALPKTSAIQMMSALAINA